jgi:hypothetical protein
VHASPPILEHSLAAANIRWRLELVRTERAPALARTPHSQDQSQAIARALEIGYTNAVEAAFQDDAGTHNSGRMLAIVVNDQLVTYIKLGSVI